MEDFPRLQSRSIPSLPLENIPAKSLLRKTSLDELPFSIARVLKIQNSYSRRSNRMFFDFTTSSESPRCVESSWKLVRNSRETTDGRVAKNARSTTQRASIGSQCVRNQYSRIETGLELVSFGFSVLHGPRKLYDRCSANSTLCPDRSA